MTSRTFRGTIVKFQGRPRIKFQAPEAWQKCLESAKIGQEIVVSIKPFKDKRSTDANAYYWAGVLTPFAEFLGYERDELHIQLRAKFLTDHSDERFPRVRSTTELDSTEFYNYVESVRQLAAELGLITEDPS